MSISRCISWSPALISLLLPIEPQTAHAMAVKQFFSDVVDSFSGSPKETTPPDVADASSGGCKNCNRGTVGDASLGALLETAGQAGNKREHMTCAALHVGESRVVDADEANSPTPVEHKYKLTRTSAYEYDVTFRPNFIQGNSGANGQNAQMRDRVKNCLGWANKALRGPNGESLKLRLQETEENPSAPPVDIRIESPGLVSTSRAYAADIDCPTVTHELLHLLGLVDEYDHGQNHGSGFIEVLPSERGNVKNGFLWDEKKRTWVRAATTEEEAKNLRELAETDYSCRALGPPDSIMRDSLEAFRGVFDSASGVLLSECRCERGSSAAALRACLDSLDRALRERLDQCPGISSPSNIRAIDFDKFDHTRPLPARLGSDAIQLAAYTDPVDASASLLKPAHFRAITRPGCAENNEYYVCSADAYNGTKGKPGREGCSLKTLPTACAGGNTEWVAK